MKKNQLVSVMFMAAVCFTPQIGRSQAKDDAARPATANRESRPKIGDTLDTPRELRTEKARLWRAKPADKIIGSQVRNVQDQSLAKINDLVVDLQRGTIAYVILESGGFLGIGDKLVAVPSQRFSLSADAKHYVLDTTKEKLTSAPSFQENNWPDASDKTWQEVIRNYHGEGLAKTADRELDPTREIPAAERLGFMRASKVDGKKVKSASGQDVGKVWDLIVDLPSGKVLFVAIDDKKTGSEMANVPPTALIAGSDKDALYLKGDFDNSPRGYWDPEKGYSRDYAGKVYEHYKTERQWEDSDVDNTRRNVRDASGESLTPLDQGTSPADREITRQLRKWIVVEPGKDRFSGLAHNIKIITREGKVTLRGPVQTAEEKQQIVAHARQLAGVTEVEDQLEVKQK